ncbi:MAG: TonB-dependent receptor [Desulfobacterales bacterium]|nr:TonB-dependent receptor [Desulfobacterales bacterium]
MKKKYLLSMMSLTLFVFSFNQLLFSGEVATELLDELSFYELEVAIASKRQESFAVAPSIITVITRKDIENLNPKTFYNLLETIPGFTLHTRNLGEPFLELRGIPYVHDQILIMIDNHPLNESIFGTGIYVAETIPLELIERIEVLRGPGSAIYGTNAAYAVINIITANEKQKNNETRFLAKYGSDNTINGVAIRKEKKDNGFLITSASILKTDGLNVNFTDRKGIKGKTFFKQEYDHLYLNYRQGNYGVLGLFGKENLGPFVGIAKTLNQKTDREYTTGALEGNANFKLTDKIDLVGKVYYDTFIYDCLWEYYPKEITPPNGQLTEAEGQVHKVGSELNFQMKLSEKESLTLGLVYDYLELTSIKTANNTDNPYQLKPTTPWVLPDHKKNFAIFVQSNYFATDKLQLVLGLRYDYDSSYGNSLNPRTGFTYELSDSHNIKLLFGQAFRGPDFFDIGSGSPDQIKNQDLNPEIVRTLDLEWNSIWLKSILVRANYYHNEITDLIRGTTIQVDGKPINIQKNLGKIKVDGIEVEVRKNWSNNKGYIALNGYVSISEDVNLNQKIPMISPYGFKFILNNNFTKNFNTSLFIKHIGKMERESNDTRDAISANTLVDTSCNFNLKSLVFKVGVYNIFNTTYVSPSNYSDKMDDYPRSGRTFQISGEYRF